MRYFVSILVLAIILMGKRELVALLCLSSWCLVIVVWLFLTMPRLCLQLWLWHSWSYTLFLVLALWGSPVWYFFCVSFVLFMSCVCHAFASVHCCLVVTCWEGLTSWLFFVMFNCVLSLFHVACWVRCGTWLYRFLIFAAFVFCSINV